MPAERSDAPPARRSITDEMRALQSELAEIEVRVSSREADTIERLRTDLDLSRTQVSRLEQQTSTSEQELERLRDAIATRDQQVKELQITVASKDKIIDTIEEGCAQLRAEFVRADRAHQDRIKELEEQLHCRDEMLAVANAQLAQLRENTAPAARQRRPNDHSDVDADEAMSADDERGSDLWNAVDAAERLRSTSAPPVMVATRAIDRVAAAHDTTSVRVAPQSAARAASTAAPAAPSSARSATAAERRAAVDALESLWAQLQPVGGASTVASSSVTARGARRRVGSTATRQHERASGSSKSLANRARRRHAKLMMNLENASGRKPPLPKEARGRPSKQRPLLAPKPLNTSVPLTTAFATQRRTTTAKTN